VRSPFIKKALEYGTVWSFSSKEKKFILVVKPNSANSSLELVEKLANLSPKDLQISVKEKKQTSYFYIGVVKLLTGYRHKQDKTSNSNKSMFSIGPWKLQGILLPESNNQRE
jgi:hypothetical protein